MPRRPASLRPGDCVEVDMSVSSTRTSAATTALSAILAAMVGEALEYERAREMEDTDGSPEGAPTPNPEP